MNHNLEDVLKYTAPDARASVAESMSSIVDEHWDEILAAINPHILKNPSLAIKEIVRTETGACIVLSGPDKKRDVVVFKLVLNF